MTTKRLPKLNKAQIKAYADKYRDDWYEKLCLIDKFNRNLNENNELQSIAKFIKSIVRPDIPVDTLQMVGRLIESGINRNNDEVVRKVIPEYKKNERRGISERSIADSMRKSFENELLINPYMTGDEIHAFADTHWQLMLLREELAETWAEVDAARTFKCES